MVTGDSPADNDPIILRNHILGDRMEIPEPAKVSGDKLLHAFAARRYVRSVRDEDFCHKVVDYVQLALRQHLVIEPPCQCFVRFGGHGNLPWMTARLLLQLKLHAGFVYLPRACSAATCDIYSSISAGSSARLQIERIGSRSGLGSVVTSTARAPARAAD